MSLSPNRIAIVLRTHERRIRELERRAGVASEPNPLKTSRSIDADTSPKAKPDECARS
jgi:hypothetical protein